MPTNNDKPTYKDALLKEGSRATAPKAKAPVAATVTEKSNLDIASLQDRLTNMPNTLDSLTPFKLTLVNKRTNASSEDLAHLNKLLKEVNTRIVKARASNTTPATSHTAAVAPSIDHVVDDLVQVSSPDALVSTLVGNNALSASAVSIHAQPKEQVLKQIESALIRMESTDEQANAAVIVRAMLNHAKKGGAPGGRLQVSYTLNDQDFTTAFDIRRMLSGDAITKGMFVELARQIKEATLNGTPLKAIVIEEGTHQPALMSSTEATDQKDFLARLQLIATATAVFKQLAHEVEHTAVAVDEHGPRQAEPVQTQGKIPPAYVPAPQNGLTEQAEKEIEQSITKFNRIIYELLTDPTTNKSVQEQSAEICMITLRKGLIQAEKTFMSKPYTEATFKAFDNDCRCHIENARVHLWHIKAPELSRFEKISNSIVKVLVEIGKALGMVNKAYEPTLFKAAPNTVKEKFENNTGSSIKERLLNEKGVLPEIGKHLGPKGGGK